MKKNFKLAMLAFAAVATAFTGCSNDNDEPGVNPDGDKGYVSFTVKSGDLSTRAVSTTQTSSESNLATVDVFVFRAGGNLEKNVTLTVGTDVTATANPNEYELTTPIEVIVESGKSIVLAGNLTAALRTSIVSAASAAFTNAYNETLANLTAANSFVMVSGKLTETVTTSHSSLTPLAINGGAPVSLERLAAKLAVVYDGTLSASVSVSGGTIALSSLEYGVDNMNTVFSLTTPVVSPFTSAGLMAPASYQSVHVDPTPVSAVSNTFYLMENIANGVSANATYARVRCKFTPATILDATGAAGTLNAAGDFATLAMAAGSVAYFESLAAATAYAAANPALVALGATPVEYQNGLCDYGISLEKTSGKFDVVRNTYYVITITGFGGLGIPTTPGTPTNPITPTSKGYIDFELVVEDWDTASDNPILS